MDDSVTAGFIPVTDAQAETVKAVSETAGIAIAQSARVVEYVGEVLGDVPKNLVEVFVGEHLRFARFHIANFYSEKTAEILRRRKADIEPVSPSVAVPLLEAAFEESRPELQEIWAELIAAAMDASRSSRVRYRFIETVRQLDPLDALLLRHVKGAPQNVEPSAIEYWARLLSRGEGEIAVSMENLERLGCAKLNSLNHRWFYLTTFGNELLRVCED
jgi:hypothetical protein